MKTNTIPYINSAEALSQFIKQAGISVILAGIGDQSSPLNIFPQELAKEIAAYAPEVRMAVASPSLLMAHAGEQAGFGQVIYQEGFIFADGQLCWRKESPFPANPGALLAEAVAHILNADYHFKRKHSEILNQVKLITLERLLKSKKSTKKSKAVPPKPPQDEDPYKTLGLSPGSTWDQVRKTRNELLLQYHPDKVAAMGPKLREVAEAETKKINAAFDQLERKLRPNKRKETLSWCAARRMVPEKIELHPMPGGSSMKTGGLEDWTRDKGTTVPLGWGVLPISIALAIGEEGEDGQEGPAKRTWDHPPLLL